MPLRLHPEVASTETDDGAVLLHQRTGRYWQLNTTGARVLRDLLDGYEHEGIAWHLATEHHIDHERAYRDVTAVIEQLRAAKLVETS